MKAPGRMLYILLGLAVLIAVCLAFLFPFVTTAANETRLIKIPRNGTETDVRDSLQKYFGNDFASKVMTVCKLRNPQFEKRYGAYEIEAGSNPISVARKLTGGAQSPVRITINGFRNLDLLIDRISNKLDFSADSLRLLLSKPETLSPYGLTPQQALSLFVDDSYDFYWTSSPKEVVDKIGANYLKIWNKQRTQKADSLSLTPAMVMTIASIVDEETNYAPEKGTIGRLYINRLTKGMKLQSDPTVRFAVGDFSIKRVTGKHLKIDSPYNTYMYKGLPPGPIRTTSKATIDSILNAPANSWLYMCAKEDFSGIHNFSSDYSQHLINAQKYQEELDRRGIH